MDTMSFAPYADIYPVRSGPNTPRGGEASSPSQQFELSFPPRLAKIGRRMTEMGEQYLPAFSPSLVEQEQHDHRRHSEVPGMGDEPVMCPFCNKPLPPSLLAAQSLSNYQNSLPKSRTPMKRTTSLSERSGSPMNRTSLSGKRQSTFSGTAPDELEEAIKAKKTEVMAPKDSKQSLPNGVAPPKALMDPLPVKPSTPVPSPAAAGLPAPPTRTIKSEDLAPELAEGDAANISAARVHVDAKDLRRWSSAAGIEEIEDTKPAQAAASQEPKPFPILAPPPAPSDPIPKGSSIRFNFFRRTSSNERKNEDDEETDDDEAGVPSGYARLDAPGSPDTDEEGHEKAKRLEIKDKAAEEPVEPPKVEAPSKSETVLTDVHEDVTVLKQDVEIRKVLQEVLGKVNELSTSHNILLSSHSALLTSLKIARSNLVMAEANTEMLEEELKRAKTAMQAAAARAVAEKAATAKIVAAATAASPVSRASLEKPTTPVATIAERRTPASVEAVKSPAGKAGTAQASSAATPQSSSVTSRTSTEASRPLSIRMPLPGGQPGPATGPAATSNDTSKGVFGFWKGDKKKLPGGLTIPSLPTASQVMSAIDASLPTTPTGEKVPIFDFHGWDLHQGGQGRQLPSSRREFGTSPSSAGLQRSASAVNLSNASQPMSMTTSRPTSNLNSSGVTAQSVPSHWSELTRLRQAYSSANSKMDTMAKEIAELKKGKVDMEAELEGLSQALFEEANKMVAEEKRKRVEAEEALKEVKEEREALRSTVKVLGGDVEEGSRRGSNEPGDEDDDDFDEASFQPRDLDKHYEALRKTIHHVGESVGPTALAEAAGVSETPDSNDSQDATPPSEDSTAEESGLRISIDAPTPVPPIAPASPNPWATTEPFAQPAMPTLPSLTDKSGEGEPPVNVDPRQDRVSSETSPIGELAELMKRLQSDMEKDGE